jgi:hypothetical protein
MDVSAVCAYHDETHGSRQSEWQTYVWLSIHETSFERKLWSGVLGSIEGNSFDDAAKLCKRDSQKEKNLLLVLHIIRSANLHTICQH